MKVKLTKDKKLDCYYNNSIESVLYKSGTIFDVEFNGTFYNCEVKNGPSISIFEEDCEEVVDWSLKFR